MSDAELGRALKLTALLTAVWTVPVIFGVAGHYFGTMVEGQGMPASHIVGHSLAMWYPWIPATPAIFWVTRRLPFLRGRWALSVLAHSGVLAVLFVAQTWFTLIVGQATGHMSPTATFGGQLTALVVNLLLYDVLIYGGVIATAFGVDVARRYRDRDLRASQLETQLERARLMALQGQLQPHFLFNALNSIAMLVRRERKQEALDVVVGFGELLRYVLDEAGTLDVPLEDELRFVRRYLEIEQVRHRDRLQVVFDIEPGTERAIVPNLTLQPLVENALKHGIARLSEGGVVRVIVRRAGERLRLTVENDGPPLDAGFSIEGTQGFGVRNLRDRLVALVDGIAELRLESLPNGRGVCATVALPFRTISDAQPVATDAPAARALRVG